MMLSFPRVFSSVAAVVLLCVLFQGQQPAQQQVGELYATDASVLGSVILASGGMKVLSGSSVVAGKETALLRLERGGNIRFCPRTSVSVASAPSGSNLMLGMNTGQLEVNYSLAGPSNADALITPDFRLLLEGPGDFHFAVGTDSKGDTCVRALKGNTGAVTVTELMGDTSYQVRPQEEVLFRGGRLSQRQRALPTDCGCPEPSPVLRAADAEPPPPPNSGPEATPVSSQSAPNAPAEAPLEQAMAAVKTPEAPPEIHLQMEAPFVYNADESEPMVETVTRLRMSPVPQYRIVVAPPPPVPDPATEAQSAKQTSESGAPHKRSFLGRVGGRVGSFFTSIFH
jgi:hypothetical protein